MGKNIFFSACAAVLAVSAVPANAAELLQNGNFSSGLTGWTSYITANGTISPTTPNSPPFTYPQYAETTSFNVTGSGASQALWLNAGQNNGPYGAAYEGGGVFQTFSSVGGSVSFSANIAAAATRAGDIGGIFSVLIDDVVFDFVDFGTITGTVRDTLSFTADLSAGEHTIKLQVTRPYGPAKDVRAQYWDNVSLNLTPAVPEPATWAMMIGGFALVGASMRRRKVAISFA